jgi:hypothetical protein
MSAWFDNAGILLVCIDSARSMGGMLPMFECNALDARVIHDKIWLPRLSAPGLFSAKELLCGFDGLYVFPDGAEPPVVPTFSLTTDSLTGFTASGLHSLVGDLESSGAVGYFADGCGLVCIVSDTECAAVLSETLADATTEIIDSTE